MRSVSVKLATRNAHLREMKPALQAGRPLKYSKKSNNYRMPIALFDFELNRKTAIRFKILEYSFKLTDTFWGYWPPKI